MLKQEKKLKLSCLHRVQQCYNNISEGSTTGKRRSHNNEFKQDPSNCDYAPPMYSSAVTTVQALRGNEITPPDHCSKWDMNTALFTPISDTADPSDPISLTGSRRQKRKPWHLQDGLVQFAAI